MSYMNILVSFDKKYFFPTVVMLESLFAQPVRGGYTVYAFTSDLSEKDQEKLKSFVNKSSNKIHIIPIENSDYEELGLDKYYEFISKTHHLTMSTYNRLLCLNKLPQSVDRILYLDGDMIINKSLEELYNTDLNNNVAAVIEGFTFKDEDFMLLANKDKNYVNTAIDFARQFREKWNLSETCKFFNSGVMLMDLNKLRNFSFNEKVKEFVANNTSDADDQTILNDLFRDHLKYMPFIYNCRPGDFSKTNKDYLNTYAYIIHYNQKPWNNHHLLCGRKWWLHAKKVDLKETIRIWFQGKI